LAEQYQANARLKMLVLLTMGTGAVLQSPTASMTSRAAISSRSSSRPPLQYSRPHGGMKMGLHPSKEAGLLRVEVRRRRLPRRRWMPQSLFHQRIRLDPRRWTPRSLAPPFASRLLVDAATSAPAGDSSIPVSGLCGLHPSAPSAPSPLRRLRLHREKPRYGKRRG
jgi:hypothetical protein